MSMKTRSIEQGYCRPNARLLETEGRGYVDQRIADVKALYLYWQGFPKSAGSQG